MEETTLDRPGNYIAGRFVPPRAPEGEIVLRSPADQRDLTGIHPFARSVLDDAIAAARAAFAPWRRLGDAARRDLLRRYRDRLSANAEPLARAISREIGKPLWEARAEVHAMMAKVDLSLGDGAAWTTDRSVMDLPGEIRFRPHGVVAVIGPFNFPGHLPNGQIVPALLLGNTVVLKPSEKAPGVGTWMARAFHEAGFPAGVFSVVQGDASVAGALTAHEGVDAILFTGSVAVGKKIALANVDRIERLVALELGGKNASIVLDDCDLERSAREIAFAAFATTGQRCTATSRVFATPGVADALSDRIAEIARATSVGYPFDDGVFMGPLVSEHARSTLLAAQAAARVAGYEPVVPGGALDVPGHEGFYVRPALHRARSLSVDAPQYKDCELFGPDLAVYVVRDLDEAIDAANDTRFGLSAAVFTRSRESFDRAADDLRVGVLHWNRSSAGASGRLPFGGIKQSGNHRPAGILAGVQCAYPLGVLLPAAEDAPLPSWPGFGV